MTTCTAFEGSRRIASGELSRVALEAKRVVDRGERAPVLIFDDQTSRLVEVDLRGTEDEIVEKLPTASTESATPSPEQRKVGRPKLGVVAREVTLLPRHWEWLQVQPGGASVTLRRLVDEARNMGADKDKVRQSQEAAYRFMSAMAGNEPGFEEAIRALFAGKRQRFDELIADWPIDVRDHARQLAAAALD